MREGHPHRIFRLPGAFETAVREAACRRRFFDDARSKGKISRKLLKRAGSGIHGRRQTGAKQGASELMHAEALSRPP
jgi:hypothetical protein